MTLGELARDLHELLAKSQMPPEYALDVVRRAHEQFEAKQALKQLDHSGATAYMRGLDAACENYRHLPVAHVIDEYTGASGCMDFNPAPEKQAPPPPSVESWVQDCLDAHAPGIVKRLVGKPVRALRVPDGMSFTESESGSVVSFPAGTHFLEMKNSVSGEKFWMSASQEFVEDNYKDWDAAERQGAPPAVQHDELVRLRGLLRQLFPHIFATQSSNYAIAALERAVQDEQKVALLYNPEKQDYFVADVGTHELIEKVQMARIYAECKRQGEVISHLARECEANRPLLESIKKLHSING